MAILKRFACCIAAIFFYAGCNQSVDNKKHSVAKDKFIEQPADTAKTELEYDRSLLNDLSVSQDLKTILSQTWDNEEDADAPPREVSSTIEIPSRGLTFFSDGKMVKDPRGDYRQGTWQLDETKKPIVINIKYNDGQRENFQLGKLTSDEMTLNTPDEGGKKLTRYISQGISYKNDTNDPFSIGNNWWRIKPVRSESEEQIRNRLKASIHFFVLFYDHNVISDAKTVNFTGLPTCFKWYAGGIYIQKPEELTQKWINCFHNKAQALQAREMGRQLLRKQYTWPKGESNWVKQNGFVLKQMEKNL